MVLPIIKIIADTTSAPKPHRTQPYARRLINVPLDLTSLLDIIDYHPQFANDGRFEKIIAKCKPFLIPKASNANIYFKNQKGLV